PNSGGATRSGVPQPLGRGPRRRGPTRPRPAGKRHPMSDLAKPAYVEEPALSHGQARLFVILAALLWSTSGAFTKVLREEPAFPLNERKIEALPIAFYRALCAAAVLWPLLRKRDVSFRPMMVFTAVSFAVMSALFVTALAEDTAANAILLQYTAPMWMYLAC